MFLRRQASCNDWFKHSSLGDRRPIRLTVCADSLVGSAPIPRTECMSHPSVHSQLTFLPPAISLCLCRRHLHQPQLNAHQWRLCPHSHFLSHPGHPLDMVGNNAIWICRLYRQLPHSTLPSINGTHSLDSVAASYAGRAIAWLSSIAILSGIQNGKM